MCLLIGFGWSMLTRAYLSRHDPQGWIVDREAYHPPDYIMASGLLICFVMAVFLGIRWLYRRLSNRPGM